MTWVRIDDGFLTHPKALKAGKDGRALWFAALVYSSRELTDGFIDDAALPVLGALAEVSKVKATVQKLVDIGLFDRDDGGYRVHDYLEYNRSRGTITAEREAAKRRKFGGSSPELLPNSGGSSEKVRPLPVNPVPDTRYPIPDPPPTEPEGSFGGGVATPPDFHHPTTSEMPKSEVFLKLYGDLLVHDRDNHNASLADECCALEGDFNDDEIAVAIDAARLDGIARPWPRQIRDHMPKQVLARRKLVGLGYDR